jgi:transcription elongation factor GreA
MQMPEPNHAHASAADGLAPARRGGATLRLVVTEAELRASRDELRRLEERRDRDLPARLREARTYVAADAAEEIAQIQDEQAVTETRIARLNQLLDSASVVAGEHSGDRVTIGCAVTVEYLTRDRRVVYRMTGAGGRGDMRSVSARSPIGQALMGRQAGDVVAAELPSGRVEKLRILRVTRSEPA